MKKRFSSLTFLTAIVAVLVIISSCNKKFDAPPFNLGANITANTTIKDLKARHTVAGTINAINDTNSIVISGVIVANDKSGNIYKAIYIDDSTGGIQLMLGSAGLFANYPVGMRLFIKCNGLALSDYNNNMELGIISLASGSQAITAIPSPLFTTYLVAGTLDNTVPVHLVTMATLSAAATAAAQNPSSDTLQNRLVQINNTQFADISGSLYSDTSAAKANVSRTVTECVTKKTTVIYTSGYADFANVPLAKGGGSITGVYVPYKATTELLLRDTSDVKYTNLRCDGSTGGTTTAPRISIAALRAMYSGTDIAALAGPYAIGGVVIGTNTAGSLSAGNVVIQDGNNGISLYFGGTLPYKLGDSVVVNVTGAALKNYMGSLEVDFFGVSAPAVTPGGQPVTPKVITIADLTTALATPLQSATNIENTLVQIQSVTASPSGVAFTATKTFSDPNAKTVAFYTRDAAYGSTLVPTTCLNVVGIATSFSGAPELKSRQASDISTGTGCAAGGGGGGGSTGAGITLGATSPFLLNFDGIGSGLPVGVSVRTGASATALGTDVSGAFISAPIIWTKTTAGFKNFASATGQTATTDSVTQSTSTNRALGLRQTSAAGYDPGAAFVFQIDNTTGKTGVALNFNLQSLDATGAPRTVTWKVDYATGDNPTTFTPATITPATLTTGNNVFSNTPVTVSFGNALDNQSGKVWIRVVALSASTGSGNRASTAVDDFKITWN